MQNTNTNDSSLSSVSSLTEDKHIATPAVAVRLKSSSSDLKVAKHTHGFFHKFLMFFSKIFSKKTEQKLATTIELVAIQTQKSAAPLEILATRPTLAVLNAQLAKPPVSPENIRRKLAEQEFHAMDTSQASMN